MDNRFIKDGDQQFSAPFDYLIPSLSPEYESHYDCTGAKEKEMERTRNSINEWTDLEPKDNGKTKKETASINNDNNNDNNNDGVYKLELNTWQLVMIFIAIIVIAIIYNHISELHTKIGFLEKYAFSK